MYLIMEEKINNMDASKDTNIGILAPVSGTELWLLKNKHNSIAAKAAMQQLLALFPY